MPIELHENQARVTLNTIRKLYRWNSRLTLYKLIQKTHPVLLILLVFPVIFSFPPSFFRNK